MALRKKKPCKRFMCPNLVEFPNIYCKQHEDLEIKDNTERNKTYDETIRYGEDKQYTQFYKSKAWNKVRHLALIRDNGLCIRCYRENKVVYAEIVHHIIEIKEDWSKRLDIENLECVCLSCHNKIHK